MKLGKSQPEQLPNVDDLSSISHNYSKNGNSQVGACVHTHMSVHIIMCDIRDVYSLIMYHRAMSLVRILTKKGTF